MKKVGRLAASVLFGGLLYAQQLPSPGSWSLGAPMPTARMGPFIGAIGSKIYVISGENDSSILNVNEIYDTVTNTWSTGAPIPTGRFVGASAVIGGMLYTFGGLAKSGPTDMVEAYDPATDTWSTRASMPGALDSIYGVADNGIAYVIGGFNPNGGRLSNAYSYNPATDTWTKLPPLKVGKSLPALGVIGSTIIAAGGLSNSGVTKDNEAYDPATNTWTTIAPLPIARTAGCFQAGFGTLIIAGGHSVANGGMLFTDTTVYTESSNSWASAPGVMPHGVANPGSATVGGTLYCFGGTNAGDPFQGTIYNYTQIYQPDLPPSILANGVVSASAFGGFSSISPGSWIEIYGSNLAVDTRGWAGSDFSGTNAPTSLDGSSVMIGGQAAFVDYISPGQVNVLASSSTPTGVQELTVTTPLGMSSSYSITVNPTEPGFLAPASFTVGGVSYVVAILSDGSYALPTGAIAGLNTRPAKPGDVVTLYGVGFGGVTPNIPAGELAPGLNSLASPFELSIGGTKASLSYDGLAPGYTGLYQFDVTVPGSVSGNVPLTFTLNGASGTQTLHLATAN